MTWEFAEIEMVRKTHPTLLNDAELSGLVLRYVIQIYRLGVNIYIRKPINFEKFAKVVMRLGLYWLLLNELPPKNINI